MMNRRAQEGQALLISMVTTVVLAGLGSTLLTSSQASTQEQQSIAAKVQRLSIAESALRAGVMDLSLGGSGNLGDEQNQVDFGGGRYYVVTTTEDEENYTVSAFGTYGSGTERVRAVVRRSRHVFHHAIFAGNESFDPDYVMDFGGRGDEADHIQGDVYSGNDINVWGDADLQGDLRAYGEVLGAEGYEGESQPGFDFSRVNYESSADVLVHREFSDHAYWSSDAAGGSAWQLSESNPAHIFRKNPTDRWEVGTTAKDDFFLEDPHEPVRVDSRSNGSDPYLITVNTSGETGPVRRLYYIDGNLWVHNWKTMSMAIATDSGASAQVTFVVRGNVYFSDNVFLQDPENSGVAFIAMKDPGEADSGNIYFGDPEFGTLEQMHAFMYAENNFYDNHLAADGSREVSIFGTMSAGNHVAISRTYRDHHSRLNVTMDERLRDGTIDLPGLPTQESILSYDVVSWMQF
jgi:hypothetical protein